MEKPFTDDEDTVSVDSALLESRSQARIQNWLRVHLKTTIVVSISLVALILAVAAIALVTTRPQSFEDCGSSREEATSRLCVFDQLLYAWVPKTCFPEDLHEQYLTAAQDDQWFLHTDTTPLIDRSEIADGQIALVYSNDEYRTRQCTYLWESLGLGVYQGKQVVEWATDLVQAAASNKTADCSQLFLDVFNLGKEWNTKKWLKQPVQYLKCRSLSNRGS